MEVFEQSDSNVKRRRFSRSEVLQMLCEAEDQTNKVTEVTEKLCSELMPDDRDTDLILDKLVHASECLRKKIDKLIKDQRDRKFRWKPELLEDDWISSSQYSAFQSSDQDSEGLSSQECFAPTQPRGPYEKRPLSADMHPKTRRRRVQSARDSFSLAADEFGLSTTQLAGRFKYNIISMCCYVKYLFTLKQNCLSKTNINNVIMTSAPACKTSKSFKNI